MYNCTSPTHLILQLACWINHKYVSSFDGSHIAACCGLINLSRFECVFHTGCCTVEVRHGSDFHIEIFLLLATFMTYVKIPFYILLTLKKRVIKNILNEKTNLIFIGPSLFIFSLLRDATLPLFKGIPIFSTPA